MHAVFDSEDTVQCNGVLQVSQASVASCLRPVLLAAKTSAYHLWLFCIHVILLTLVIIIFIVVYKLLSSLYFGISCELSKFNRTATARDRAEQGDIASLEARKNADLAKSVAVQFAPELFNSATSGPLPSWPQATAGASATSAASTTTRGAIAAAGAFGAASLSVPSAHLNTSLAQHQREYPHTVHT